MASKDKKYDLLYKLILIGDANIGKTNLISRYTKNKYVNRIPTIGVHFEIRIIEVDRKTIKAQIWDTSGLQRFMDIIKPYLVGAHGVLLVYDITRRDTYERIDSEWLPFVALANTNVLMLVGTKCDQQHRRAVTTEEAKAYAEDHGMLFIETSAQNSTNVEEAFQELLTVRFPVRPVLNAIYHRELRLASDTPSIATASERERQVKMFDDVLAKRGKLEQNILHCLFFGFPRAGKSSLMNRLAGQPRADLAPSTGVLMKAMPVEVRRVSTSAVVMSPSDVTNVCKWQYVNLDGEAAALIAAAVRETAKTDAGMQCALNHSNHTQESRSVTGSGMNDTLTSNGSSSFVDLPPIPLLESSPLNVLKDAVKRKGLHAVQEYLDKSMTLYLTDTGGQLEFQELLPSLLAGHYLFFLVFRLDEDLSKIFTIRYLHLDSSVAEPYQSSYTVGHTLLQSLASIATMGTSDAIGAASMRPKVVFVGTHKDKVSRRRVRQIDRQLQQLVTPTAPYRDGLIERASESQLMVAVNNLSHEDSDFSMIRSLVDRIASRGNFKITAPSTWLTFSLYIRQLEKRVISYDECFQIAVTCGIENQEELNQVLWFLHHKLGLVRYFRGAGLEDLEDVVIIDPQILFDAITRLLVGTFTFQHASSAVHEEFKKKGIFPLNVLEEISRENEDELLTTHKFVKLLGHLNVIARLHTTEATFFMPCALAHVASTAQFLIRPRTLLDHLKQLFSFIFSASTNFEYGSSSVPPPLLVTFKCGYVPRGLFGALAVFLLANKVESPNEITLQTDKIFRNSISFAFGPLDFVALTTESNYLEVSVVSGNPEIERIFPISDTCVEVRRCIDLAISRVLASLNYTQRAAHSLAFFCTRPHEGVKELHPAVLQLHRNEPCSICCEVTGTKLVYGLPKGYQLWFPKDNPINQAETACTNHDLSTPPTLRQDAAEVIPNADLSTLPNIQQVDSTKLDLSAAINAVGSLAARWRLLGLSLGLPPSALEVIEADYARSAERLYEVLKEWLAEHGSPPCWRGLVAAVANPSGGNDTSLAQEIALRHV